MMMIRLNRQPISIRYSVLFLQFLGTSNFDFFMKSFKNISPVKCFKALIGLASVFVFVACEKEIDVDLRTSDPKVVIEGVVAEDSLAYVRITKTKDFYSDNDFPPVSGAVVTITSDEGKSEVLQQNSKGIYFAHSMRGEVNRTYSLHVLLEGKEYTATSKMPKKVDIEKIEMFFIPSFDYSVPKVFFQDIPGEENYYRGILYLNYTRMDIGNEAMDAKNRDGVLIERILPVFDDDKENSRKVEKGDKVIVELQSIDKGAFTFFDTFGRMGASQNNPTGNITGGALGYFSAYSYDRKFIIAD